MKKNFRNCLLLFTLMAAVAMYSTNAFAHDKKQPSPEEMAKMMEAWHKAAAPGAPHTLLARMSGNWTYHMTMWGMGEKPMESDGIGKSDMVFEGRYLRMTSSGTMMGMPFEGMGTLGYDNFKNAYQMTWIDNMSTTTTTASGNSVGNTISLMGKMDEPTTGEKDKDVRWVFRITDDDHHVLEAYDLVGTPQEFKVFEIAYTRKK